MRVLVTAAGARSDAEVWVVVAPDDATADAVAGVLPGGRLPGGHRPVGGSGPLLHGASFRAGGEPERPEGAAALWVAVVEGPSAGATTPLRPGRPVVVGRAPACDLVLDDPTVSRTAVRVHLGPQGVTLTQLGATNPVHGVGTDQRWAPGMPLRLGSSSLALLARERPATIRAAPGVTQVVPWPRVRPEVEPVDLTTPPAPTAAHPRPPSAWSWGLPLVVALALAAVLRMPVLLLFALLGPTMVLGHHLGERRSSRADHRRALASYAARCAELTDLAGRLARSEELVRRERDPGLTGVLRSLLPAVSDQLWCRAAEDLRVTVGVAPGTSGEVRVDGEPVVLADAGLVLDVVPPLTVVGPARARDGVVRAVLLQLVTAYPPSRLAIEVDPEQPPPPGWELLAWLPHVVPPGAAPAGATVLRWGVDLRLVPDEAQAPHLGTRVVVADAASGVVRQPGRPDRSFMPSTLGPGPAMRLARRLAPLREASDLGADRTRPAQRWGAPTLGDLVPWPSDVEDVRTGWAGGPQTRLHLGTGADGAPMALDLAKDGPHALVAGTTGSGKSELLRNLVLSLAVTNSPAEMAFLLVDFKGGATFRDLAGLPHCAGVVDDLDGQLARRVLSSLTAEIARRERLLGEHGVRELSELPGGRRPPRLVVVVDEFRVLADAVPDALGALARLAAVGRSMGLHLVLATQRPAGVVPADLRANVNLRIALRVRDVTDSLDILDSSVAAGIPEDRPGRAFVRTGGDAPRELQVVPVGPPSRDEDRWSLTRVPDVWAGWRQLHAAPARLGSDGLADVLPLLQQVAAGQAVSAPTVWVPPLPDCLGSLPAGAWALADRPDRQRQEPVVWGADASLAIAGSPGSGRTTALRSLLDAAPPSWLYVLDLGGALARTGLPDDPRVRAWVAPAAVAQGSRVLETVAEEIGRRQRGDPGPPVVVVVDGWDRLVTDLGEHQHGRPVELARRILRDGPAVGVVTLVTGDRAVLLGPVARTVPETWVLRLHDVGDLLLTGLARGDLPLHQPPGRAVRTGDGLVAQVRLPGPTASVKGETPPLRLGPPPPALVDLPAEVPAARDRWAVGGDLAQELPAPAGHVLVLGPPGSGRSTTLAGLAGADDRWVRPRDPGWREVLAGVVRDPAVDGGAALVVDDLHLLTAGAEEDLLLDHLARGRRLLVAGDLDQLAGSYRGLVPQLARAGTGLVLQPGRADHGAPWHVALPTGDLRVPGRGVLVSDGRCLRVQVARPSARAGP